MVTIRNKLGQKIIVNLKGGISRDLLENSTINLKPEEFSSAHVQNLLERGIITVASMEEKPKKKWADEHDERAGTGASGIGETIEPEESVASETEKQPEEMHEPEPKKTGYVRKKK